MQAREEQQLSCTKAIERLKKGPVNIPQIIEDGIPYVDENFTGKDTLYWNNHVSESFKTSIDRGLDRGTMYFERWEKKFPYSHIFEPNTNIPSYTEAV